jgi:hypothetical protein
MTLYRKAHVPAGQTARLWSAATTINRYAVRSPAPGRQRRADAGRVAAWGRKGAGRRIPDRGIRVRCCAPAQEGLLGEPGPGRLEGREEVGPVADGMAAGFQAVSRVVGGPR